MKWIYHCDYCAEKTLEDVKRDSITCGYCEHPAHRMQSTAERIEREQAFLELEQKTRDAAIVIRKKRPWWNRWLY